MKAITYTAARGNLASTMDEVCNDRVPITITRSGKQQAVVLMSLTEFSQLEETAHLLRSPKNAQRLISAVEGLTNGHGKEHKINLNS